jgi:hypothetical protein
MRLQLKRNQTEQCCGSGSGIQCFFTLLNPGWIFSGSQIQIVCFFGENFLRILGLWFFLLIKLFTEAIRSKKKVGFNFHPSFSVPTVGSGIRCFFYPHDPESGSRMKNWGIRNKKNIPDPQHRNSTCEKWRTRCPLGQTNFTQRAWFRMNMA